MIAIRQSRAARLAHRDRETAADSSDAAPCPQHQNRQAPRLMAVGTH